MAPSSTSWRRALRLLLGVIASTLVASGSALAILGGRWTDLPFALGNAGAIVALVGIPTYLMARKFRRATLSVGASVGGVAASLIFAAMLLAAKPSRFIDDWWSVSLVLVALSGIVGAIAGAVFVTVAGRDVPHRSIHNQPDRQEGCTDG